VTPKTGFVNVKFYVHGGKGIAWFEIIASCCCLCNWIANSIPKSQLTDYKHKRQDLIFCNDLTNWSYDLDLVSSSLRKENSIFAQAQETQKSLIRISSPHLPLPFSLIHSHLHILISFARTDVKKLQFVRNFDSFILFKICICRNPRLRVKQDS